AVEHLPPRRDGEGRGSRAAVPRVLRGGVALQGAHRDPAPAAPGPRRLRAPLPAVRLPPERVVPRGAGALLRLVSDLRLTRADRIPARPRRPADALRVHGEPSLGDRGARAARALAGGRAPGLPGGVGALLLPSLHPVLQRARVGSV